MPRPGMWEGINQGMRNAMQAYSMRQQMAQNKQDREIRLAQMFFTSRQGYARLVDSGASPNVLRAHRQMDIDIFTKLGVPIPKNYLNITDPKKLIETGENAFYENTVSSISAWSDKPSDEELEIKALTAFSMASGQKGLTKYLKPWETKLNAIQIKKTTLAKQKADKAKLVEERGHQAGLLGEKREYEAGKIPIEKPIKVWDTQLNKYVYKKPSDAAKEPERYGMTEEQAKEMKRAGAPSMTQIISGEKFEIKKGITAGKTRSILIGAKNNKDIYDANAPTFNATSTRVVTYWDTIKDKKWYQKEETKFVSLTKKNIAEGWTPKEVQEFARKNGMTIKEVLQELRIVK